MLATDAAPWVRAGVALRGDAPESAINSLLRDEDHDVLSALGRNPRTPPAQLAAIASHPDKDVRRSVVFNPSAGFVALGHLVEDPYPLNRALVAGHPGLPGVLAAGLLGDPDPQVRFSAAARLARAATTEEQQWSN